MWRESRKVTADGIQSSWCPTPSRTPPQPTPPTYPLTKQETEAEVGEGPGNPNTHYTWSPVSGVQLPWTSQCADRW